MTKRSSTRHSSGTTGHSSTRRSTSYSSAGRAPRFSTAAATTGTGTSGGSRSTKKGLTTLYTTDWTVGTLPSSLSSSGSGSKSSHSVHRRHRIPKKPKNLNPWTAAALNPFGPYNRYGFRKAGYDRWCAARKVVAAGPGLPPGPLTPVYPRPYGPFYAPYGSSRGYGNYASSATGGYW
jgi:hypothetical protein